jgi:NAD(P)-dependent dehydrogenase (short-subunit alcohol dehydrogenase family)
VRLPVTNIEAHLSGIDVLVNNAGTMRSVGPIWKVDSVGRPGPTPPPPNATMHPYGAG